MPISFDSVVEKIKHLNDEHLLVSPQSASSGASASAWQLLSNSLSRSRSVHLPRNPLAELVKGLDKTINDFSNEMIALRCPDNQRIKLLLGSLMHTVENAKLDEKDQTLLRSWKEALYQYLAEQLEIPQMEVGVASIAHRMRESQKNKRAKAAESDGQFLLKMNAVIDTLSRVELPSPMHHLEAMEVVFDSNIINFPPHKFPISHRFKNFFPLNLPKSIEDYSLLHGDEEVILFGTTPLNSINKIRSGMRVGQYAVETDMYGKTSSRTPSKETLRPGEIATPPPKRAGTATQSPWRKSLAENASIHIALDEIIRKITELFTLDNITDEQACKIAAIVLEHDKNPLTHAWRWILFALQKQNVFVFSKNTTSVEKALYPISIERVKERLYLVLQFNLEITGVYIIDRGIVEIDSGAIVVKQTCHIDLQSFDLFARRCSVVVNHRELHPLVKSAADELKVKVKVWETEFNDYCAGKNSLELVNILPLTLPIPQSLWQEYSKLNITPEDLWLHAEKVNAEAQAEKDYMRALAVKGMAIPEFCAEPNGKANIAMVKHFIDRQFTVQWHDWQQLTLSIFLGQAIFNPIECLWYRFIAILDEAYQMSFFTEPGVQDIEKFYNLTHDEKGHFCLTGGFQVKKIYDKAEAKIFEGKDVLIRYQMQVIFPTEKNKPFDFNLTPSITIFPDCKPYARKLILALHTMASRTLKDVNKYGVTTVIEQIGSQEKEIIDSVRLPGEEDEVRRHLFAD